MKNIIALCCLISTLSACGTTNTYENANSRTTEASYVQDKRIITDYSLNSYAHVESINEAIVNGDLLKVQAKIVNSSSSRRAFHYKFTWLDAYAMELQSVASPWVVLVLEAGESKYISAIATSPKAVDFSLKIVPYKKD